MTINEFKAWLEGFDAAVKTAPTTEQWEQVKRKLETVSENHNKVYRSPSVKEPDFILLAKRK
jgi:hypothetical protein